MSQTRLKAGKKDEKRKKILKTINKSIAPKSHALIPEGYKDFVSRLKTKI